MLFNGRTAAEVGVHLRNFAKFVEQEDRHLPLLTVRESLTMSERFQHAHVDVGSASKVDTILDVLRLRNCADTIVGNEFIRGVSGGEKRRLTIGEMLMGNPRVLCLDEVTCVQHRVMLAASCARAALMFVCVSMSVFVFCVGHRTGLDSTTAFEIISSLQAWASETGGTLVASLLQPTPEIMALFDNVVLLQEGHVVFAGERQGACG